MAARRQPLMPGWLLPGALSALLCAVALLALGALLLAAPATDWRALLGDSYLHHVLAFSFEQALLSALLSVLPAILLARALYRRRFTGRTLLLRLCAMTLVLPVLVAVFGLLSVYGRSGWLAQLCHSRYRLSLLALRPAGAFCWRTCSLICRWRRACCCRRWRAFPASSASWRQLGLRGWSLFRLLSGRGCAVRCCQRRR